ncbi:MAG: NapC/NirT family cytochrome c [Pseudomonadota bacterium]
MSDGADKASSDGASDPRQTGWQLAMSTVWRSKIGVLGVLITTVSAALILVALLQDLLFGGLGPYAGIISYMMLPAGFLAGLALIPLALYLQRRRALRGEPEKSSRLVLDLTNPKHQRLLVFVSGMSVVNLALLSVLGYQAYHFTESTAFCGKLCHSVMEPEYTAYQRSPHARVACVECHIGSGASWFVKSKISGLRQVWGVLTDDFSKPVPAPIHNLRPARDTCEQCHWPEVFHGTRPKIFYHYSDEGSVEDPEISAVMLHVGGHDKKTGSYQGIHWHVSRDLQVQYRALDEKRAQIREVKVVRTDGSEKLFVNKAMPEVPEGTEWRRMDCVDCHNRPTHIYDTAEDSVDGQIRQGRLDPTLPEYRSAALEVVQAAYPSREAARQGLVDNLLKFYTEKHPEVAQARRADIEKQAAVLYEQVWSANIYPAMKITWGTYPTQLGHHNDSGCFRCHADQHSTDTGETISQDCDQCHNLVVQEQKLSELDENIKHLLF